MLQAKMTKKEQEIYQFIVDYRKSYNSLPSLREISKGVNLYSHSTVSYHVNIMVEKGFLTRRPGKANSICPVTE